MFSKQPKDKPSLSFDLRHLPKKTRDKIETSVTLGSLEDDPKLTGCGITCGGGPGFFVRPNTYHIEQALNAYYNHLGAKTYMAVGGIRVIIESPAKAEELKMRDGATVTCPCCHRETTANGDGLSKCCHVRVWGDEFYPNVSRDLSPAETGNLNTKDARAGD